MNLQPEKRPRSTLGKNRNRDYLRLLKEQTGFLDMRINWDVINADQIVAYSSGKEMGLQIADAIASSAFYAVQLSQHGYTEDRYIRMLKPVIYHRQGRYLGYGLKFWPKEVDDMLENEEQIRWVQTDFK